MVMQPNRPAAILEKGVLGALVCSAIFQAGVLVLNWRLYSVGEPGGFATFYSTVILAHQHGIARIYDIALQNAYHPRAFQAHAYWYHLSYEILLLWPLGYFSQSVAFLVWTFTNVACVLAGSYFFL